MIRKVRLTPEGRRPSGSTGREVDGRRGATRGDPLPRTPEETDVDVETDGGRTSPKELLSVPVMKSRVGQRDRVSDRESRCPEDSRRTGETIRRHQHVREESGTQSETERDGQVKDTEKGPGLGHWTGTHGGRGRRSKGSGGTRPESSRRSTEDGTERKVERDSAPERTRFLEWTIKVLI